MTGPYVGVQGVATVSVTASGSVTLSPARSNSPFKNLGFTIIPEDALAPYEVDVYNAGELVEHHAFSSLSDTVVCHMSYPDKIFPANIGTNAIPKFADPSNANPVGVSITVVITNLYASPRTFVLYSTYEEYDSPRFVKLN